MSNNFKESFNNNKNSVINIVKEVLGKDAQEHIVNSLVRQIMENFNGMDNKLDKLLDNQAFVDNLMLQINQAIKNNISLQEQLEKSQKERESLLSELEKIKSEQVENKDIDFKQVIDEAEKALENYDSQKYQDVLLEYRENKKHKQLVKNIAKTHYLSAKNYAGDFYFDKAKKEIEKALVLDDDNVDYIGWYGSLLFDSGNYDKAIEFYQKSLAIKRATLGEKHPSIANTYNNLGNTWYNKGNYDKAIEFYQKSLAIKRATLGENHPSTASTYNNLGNTWDKKGNYDKAITFYKKALKIRLDRLGENHPHTKQTKNNIRIVKEKIKQ